MINEQKFDQPVKNDMRTCSIPKNAMVQGYDYSPYDTTFCNTFKACVRYFSLFLKEQYVSWLFRTKYFEIKFNLQLLYLQDKIALSQDKIKKKLI